jgi:hypothetical protein
MHGHLLPCRRGIVSRDTASIHPNCQRHMMQNSRVTGLAGGHRRGEAPGGTWRAMWQHVPAPDEGGTPLPR